MSATTATTPDIQPVAGPLPANPFDRDEHLAHSSYHARDGRRLVNLSQPDASGDDALHAAAVDGAFRAFVTAPDYPCVGAKSAANNNSYRLGLYGELGGAAATAGLCRDLFRFRHELDDIDAHFASFVAVFDGPDLDERGFERRLWRQLQALHLEDAPLHDWDADVSSDPDEATFSFSFAGRAFFVVGLHPASNRFSRRFPWPTMVFNAHDQFERLRNEGKMDRMKQVIRTMDEKLQGVPNPSLQDFGDASEARQYSGRHTEPDWSPPFEAVTEKKASKCPFHRLFGRS
jgi:FPC/CPF motif-containing protein YcgG